MTPLESAFPVFYSSSGGNTRPFLPRWRQADGGQIDRTAPAPGAGDHADRRGGIRAGT